MKERADHRRVVPDRLLVVIRGIVLRRPKGGGTHGLGDPAGNVERVIQESEPHGVMMALACREVEHVERESEEEPVDVLAPLLERKVHQRFSDVLAETLTRRFREEGEPGRRIQAHGPESFDHPRLGLGLGGRRGLQRRSRGTKQIHQHPGGQDREEESKQES